MIVAFAVVKQSFMLCTRNRLSYIMVTKGLDGEACVDSGDGDDGPDDADSWDGNTKEIVTLLLLLLPFLLLMMLM